MGKIANFSERIKTALAFRNCTYCAMLTVLRYGGKDDFPLPPEEEHQALRAADTNPTFDTAPPGYTGLFAETFGGASFAVKARYGIDMHLVPDQSRTGIIAALGVKRRAYAIAGRLSNFPTGHTLRRHAPNFTGFHATALITLPTGEFQWLDPLDTEGSGGQPVTLDQVLQFIGGNYPQDARYLAEDELGADMTPIPASNFTHVTKQTSLATSAPFRAAPSASAAVHQTYPAGTAFPVDVIVSAEGSDWYGGWLYVNAGGFIYGYFGTGVLNPLTDAGPVTSAPVPGPTPADVAATVTAAVTKRDAEWKAKIGSTLLLPPYQP